jgi:hypothetical protein
MRSTNLRYSSVVTGAGIGFLLSNGSYCDVCWYRRLLPAATNVNLEAKGAFGQRVL